MFINQAVKKSIGKMSVEEIKYSIDIITKIINNKNFDYDKALFLNRILELTEAYNARMRDQNAY